MKNLERTVEFYIDRALERSGATSDRKLSELLGMASNTISLYRSGKIKPSPDAIIKLALIAGIDPAIAVTDLNIWNTEGEAQQVYKKILKKMTAAVVALFLLVSIPNAAHASMQGVTPEVATLALSKLYIITSLS